MKTTQFSLIAMGVTLVLGSLLPLTILAQNDQAATSTDAQRLKIPSPIEEITQLSKSGVGDAVVLTYIQNSNQRYNLNAQDIISLRDQGVSAEVTTALIRRGAEVRQAAVEAYNQQKRVEAATIAAAPTYQTQPVEVAPAPVTYYAPVQPVSTVSVAYIGYPSYSYYSGYYPRYRYYSSPSYCYTPRVSFGIGFGGGYRHGGFRSSARFCR